MVATATTQRARTQTATTTPPIPRDTHKMRIRKPQAAIKCRKPRKVARQGGLNAKETGLSGLEAMKCYAALSVLEAASWRNKTSASCDNNPLAERDPYGSDIPYSRHDHPVAAR